MVITRDLRYLRYFRALQRPSRWLEVETADELVVSQVTGVTECSGPAGQQTIEGEAYDVELMTSSHSLKVAGPVARTEYLVSFVP